MSETKERNLRVSFLDLAILLFHVHRGAQLEEVGFEDCDRTLKELTKELAPKRVLVNKSALESALWSANLMDEIGEFWSPSGESFDAFVRRLLHYASPEERLEFDRMYNFIREKRASSQGEAERKKN
jgi:hypothetical protein